MKKISLICAVALMGMSLTACGSQSSKAKNSSSEVSSLKKENSQLKKHKKQSEKKDKPSQSQQHNSSSNSNASNSSNSSNPTNSKQQSQSNNGQQASNNDVNSADEAVAAARAKYGDDNGAVQWGYMVDGDTGQPIRNADGSYFIKGTDGQTMSGTRYSVNVSPDGTITSN